ncbi:MAG: hypothetical protein HC933_00715 [Pleurocapsa sp. SU_196_0]|nr:hypothetical protein [Pleurocapsa sp. SU_196_0]
MKLTELTPEQLEFRLLELPALIADVSGRLTALRAEKRTLERTLEGIEAASHTSALSMEDYKALRNAEDRKAFLRMRLEANENWQAKMHRLEQLQATIEKYNAEREQFDDEHKSIRATLEGRYAQIIEKALTDAMLTNAVRRVAA